MSKKILILTPFYPPNIGGAESFIEGLAKEASKCCHVSVLTFHPFLRKSKKFEQSKSSEGSLKVYRMNWLVKHSKAWQGVSLKNALSVIPQMALKSIFLCVKERPKIVHAQGLLTCLVGVFLKKIFRCKLYLTLLALYDFESKGKIFQSVSKWIFKNCDIIFCEGKNAIRDVAGMYKKDYTKHGYLKARFKIFNHWVDQEVFKPPVKPRTKKKIKILFVGRPIKKKGIHVIKAAEEAINDKRMEFNYVENVPFEDLPKYYQSNHVLVIPSLYSEGFTRVVAESASCGCALIVSNRGSLPEMVEPFGWVINQHDFMRVLKGLLIVPEEVDKMSKLSLEYARENFSPKNAEVFLNEYKIM